MAHSQNDRVALRVLRPTDYDALYETATVPGNGLYERFRGATPSPDDFVKALWGGILVQFVPETEHRMMGLLVAHNASFVDGVVRVVHLAYDEFDDRDHESALLQFLDYLFVNWELRKIYAEVPEFRRDRFLSRGGRIFCEEGCLRDHQFLAGRYWSTYIYGLTRSQWEQAHQSGVNGLNS
jgi:hypothetical protein